jgi:hypothetical protein
LGIKGGQESQKVCEQWADKRGVVEYLYGTSTQVTKVLGNFPGPVIVMDLKEAKLVLTRHRNGEVK